MINPRSTLIAGVLLTALPVGAQDAAEVLDTAGTSVPVVTTDDVPLGGVGRLACAQVAGAGNFEYLGQAADWALGYMAGRLDAGQTVVEDAALSPSDPIDLVTGIAARCAETPDAPVIDAVREIAAKIFGETAEGGRVAADAPPPPPEGTEPGVASDSTAPPARPEDLQAPPPESDGAPSNEAGSDG